MEFRKGKFIFSLAVIFLLVSVFFFLLWDAAMIPAVEPEPMRRITPAFSMGTEDPAEAKIIFYPKNPAPGDFLIVEAGPVTNEASFELIIDFPGAVSSYYRLGNLLYAVIAISYNTEPETYQLSLQTDPAGTDSPVLEAELIIAEKDFLTSRFSMPASRTAGWTAERLAEDREKVRLARETTEPHPLWLQRFISPLEGRVSSEYGAIRIINENPPRKHSGIDIAAEEGTPIVAPNRGIVRLAEFLLSGGNTVIIDHGIDLSSTYMHLHTIAVEEGQLVERGELIGTVGMTGYATGPHLHWEVNIGQTPVNPEQLMLNELMWIPPAYVKQKITAGQ